MATPFIIKKGLSSALSSEPTISGTIYFCTDTGEMFVGEDGQKIKITNIDLEQAINDLESETIKNIAVNDSNITISNNTATIPTATTNRQGTVQLSSATNSSSNSLAATASAVKTAYDLASSANITANSKQATITGAATTITGSNLIANRALISNSSGKIAVSAVTNTELGYLDGVTSNIQTQLNNKATKDEAESIFWVEYGVTSFNDIMFAYNSGKLCVMYYESPPFYDSHTILLSLSLVYDNNYLNFCGEYLGTIYIVQCCLNNNTSTWGNIMYSRLQTQDSLVDTIIGNENVLTKYPSTYAVANYVTSQIGAFLNSSS